MMEHSFFYPDVCCWRSLLIDMSKQAQDYLAKHDPMLNEQIRIAQKNMAIAQREQVKEAATEIGYAMLLYGGDLLKDAILKLGEIGLPVLSAHLLRSRDYGTIEFWGCRLQTRQQAPILYDKEVKQEWNEWCKWLLSEQPEQGEGE